MSPSCDYSSSITKIKVKSNRATSVITSTGDEIDADVVICNADPPTVYKEMLDPKFSKKALINEIVQINANVVIKDKCVIKNNVIIIEN